MTKTHKVLLGANEYNEIVFGEFGIKSYEDEYYRKRKFKAKSLNKFLFFTNKGRA